MCGAEIGVKNTVCRILLTIQENVQIANSVLAPFFEHELAVIFCISSIFKFLLEYFLIRIYTTRVQTLSLVA